MNNIKKQRHLRVTIGTTNLFGNELILFILIIPLFKSSGFDNIPMLSQVCNAMLTVEAVFFGIIAALKGRLSSFGVAMIIYGVWAYGIAPIFSGYPAPSYFYIFGAISIIVIFELAADSNPTLLLKTLRNAFVFFVTLNFVLMLLKPKGLDGQGCFLLGIRTGLSLYIIPGLLFCILYDMTKRNKISNITVFYFFISIATLLLQWVATGILEIAIVTAMLCYCFIAKKPKINATILVSITFAINIVVVFIGVAGNKLINWLVVDILHKDITFSSRTLIWEAFIKDLNANPIFGYGAHSSISIHTLTMTRPSHNQWLYYMHESGYVGGLIILIGIILSIKMLEKYKGENEYNVITVFIFAIFFACTSEIQCYAPLIYGLLELPFLLNRFKFQSGIKFGENMQKLLRKR